MFQKIRIGRNKQGSLSLKSGEAMEEPVIHHLEICVSDLEKRIEHLKKHGFRPFAKKSNSFCKQIALKLNSIVLIVSEKATTEILEGSIEDDLEGSKKDDLEESIKYVLEESIKCVLEGSKNDDQEGSKNDDQEGSKNDDQEGSKNDDQEGSKKDDLVGSKNDDLERSKNDDLERSKNDDLKGSKKNDSLCILCPRCEEGNNENHVDTVFNIALNIKNLRTVEKVREKHPTLIVEDIKEIKDEHGELSYAIIKSLCDNVVHTLIVKENYHGPFLPGFEMLNIDEMEECDLNKEVTHIDHVTCACRSETTQDIIEFYRSCFGMEKFGIRSHDEEEDDDDVIMKEGVGLKLQAMEFWKCNETGLICPNTKAYQRDPNSMMLVLVESLRQKCCNVLSFLEEHGPGIEHIALASNEIVDSVSNMVQVGVRFRMPPQSYYDELEKMPEIVEVKTLQMEKISKLGILVDREKDKRKRGASSDTETEEPRILMQVFTQPLFAACTFFLEYIERQGSRGLGAGNIVALVRSIREDERRKAAERDKSQTTNASTNMLRQY